MTTGLRRSIPAVKSIVRQLRYLEITGQHIGTRSPGCDSDPGRFRSLLRFRLRKARFEVRSAGGDASQLLTLAAELASLSVDVLVTYQTPPIPARDTGRRAG
jgi:hypothetical protein